MQFQNRDSLNIVAVDKIYSADLVMIIKLLFERFVRTESVLSNNFASMLYIMLRRFRLFYEKGTVEKKLSCKFNVTMTIVT